MSRKKRYIQNLSAQDVSALEAGMKSRKGYQYNQRCHAVLLSYRGSTTAQLMEIFGVQKNTIYSWFDRYESGGVSGLENRPGRGRKALLRTDNKLHVEAVGRAVAKINRRGGSLLAEVEAELDLERGISKKILRTFLKGLDTSGSGAGES